MNAVVAGEMLLLYRYCTVPPSHDLFRHQSGRRRTGIIHYWCFIAGHPYNTQGVNSWTGDQSIPSSLALFNVLWPVLVANDWALSPLRSVLHLYNRKIRICIVRHWSGLESVRFERSCRAGWSWGERASSLCLQTWKIDDALVGASF